MMPSENRLADPSIAPYDVRRVGILYRLTPRSVAISIVVGAITAATIWQAEKLPVLWWWFGSIVLVSAGRYAAYLAFRRRRPDGSAIARWELAHAAGAGAMGLMWTWLVYIGPLPAVYEVLVVFVLGGMSMGSAGVLGASVKSFLAFNVPMLLAQTIELFYMGGTLYTSMGMMAVLFAAGLTTAFIEFRRALLTSLEAQRQLELMHNEQRLMFENATIGVSFNRDRHVMDCNPQFAAMLGYTQDEIIGTSMREHYADATTWDEIGGAAYDQLRQGRPFRKEILYRTKSGGTLRGDSTMQSLLPREPDKGVVVIVSDVTALREQEFALRQALLEQLAIFNTAPAGILFQRKRVVEHCNEEICRMTGREHDDIVGKTTEEWFDDPRRWEMHGRNIYGAFSRGESYSYEDEFRRADGSHFWCRVRGGAIDPNDPVDGPAVFVLVDTTDRHNAEEALKQSREQLVQVIRASQSGIWDYDLATREITFSGRFYEILGYSVTSDAQSLMPIMDRVHPDDRERMERVFAGHIVKRLPINEAFRLRRADGSYVWVRGHGQATWNDAGRATRFVGSIADISELKRQEDQIRRLALEDPLTGIPNRRLLEDRLQHALASASRDGQQVAVMLIDLNGFKSINDRFGHAAGDSVLCAVADRLRAAVREADTVARIGGDEFVVLIEGLQQREDAGALAGKLLEKLVEPMGSGDYKLGASIGIASFPADGNNPDELLKLADKAMYAVKQSGNSGYRFAGNMRATSLDSPAT